VTALEPLHLSCPAADGEVYDHGAHVTSWIPAGQPEVLWLSSAAVFAPNAAIRGGVPIVFPWFGAGRTGDLAPAHGFARLTPWRRVDVTTGPDAVTATYGLSSADVDSGAFPFCFEARYTVTLGAGLALTLEVENTDDVPFTYEEALHTYLRVGESSEVRISGLDGETYVDKWAPGEARTQHGDVTFVGEVDRVYHCGADVTLSDPVLGRMLHVETAGSDSTVVWNPGRERAATMPDIGPEEWRTMVCIEGANVGASAVTLEPGESHSLRYALTVH
jgi:glucose-6-phosphate 1-epimerase